MSTKVIEEDKSKTDEFKEKLHENLPNAFKDILKEDKSNTNEFKEKLHENLPSAFKGMIKSKQIKTK